MIQDLSYMRKQLSSDILSLFLAAVSVVALAATGVVSQPTSMTRIIVDSVNGTALPISILSVVVIALHRKILVSFDITARLVHMFLHYFFSIHSYRSEFFAHGK